MFTLYTGCFYILGDVVISSHKGKTRPCSGYGINILRKKISRHSDFPFISVSIEMGKQSFICMPLELPQQRLCWSLPSSRRAHWGFVSSLLALSKAAFLLEAGEHLHGGEIKDAAISGASSDPQHPTPEPHPIFQQTWKRSQLALIFCIRENRNWGDLPEAVCC